MRTETGSVTAEAAVVLPALTMVLTLALWALAAAGARIECIDAARAAARAAARGEAHPAVRSAAERAAPGEAEITIERADGQVRATVRSRVRPAASWLPDFPGVTVHGRAVAAVEGT